jgi:hypothetical protein
MPLIFETKQDPVIEPAIDVEAISSTRMLTVLPRNVCNSAPTLPVIDN